MTNSYSVLSGMSTEKYHKRKLEDTDYDPPDSLFSTLPGPFTVWFTTASPS
jgi:hypothetical protein